jgi:chaperonin cofactor prefoldin
MAAKDEKITKELMIQIETLDNKVKATVTKTSSNGEKSTKTLEGSKEEIDAQIEEFKMN